MDALLAYTSSGDEEPQDNDTKQSDKDGSSLVQYPDSKKKQHNNTLSSNLNLDLDLDLDYRDISIPPASPRLVNIFENFLFFFNPV